MRIITGKYKGRHFEVPRTFKARPTTDFAKENLFNVLRAYVVTVEKDRRHFAFIEQCRRTLGDSAWQPLCGDVLKFVERCAEPFDLVFADPPYALPELPELPERVLGSKLLAPGALFVLEHGKTQDFSAHPAFLEHRTYGSVNFSFFRNPEEQA